jgi:hypothetical protein
MFDEAARKKRHAEIFPVDLKKAAELGASLASLCTSEKS